MVPGCESHADCPADQDCLDSFHGPNGGTFEPTGSYCYPSSHRRSLADAVGNNFCAPVSKIQIDVRAMRHPVGASERVWTLPDVDGIGV